MCVCVCVLPNSCRRVCPCEGASRGLRRRRRVSSIGDDTCDGYGDQSDGVALCLTSASASGVSELARTNTQCSKIAKSLLKSIFVHY